MKLAQIGKRIFLFLAVNTLVVVTISLVLSLFGVNSRLGSGRFESLMVFCLVWGMGGAFVSLGLSRLMAKWFRAFRNWSKWFTGLRNGLACPKCRKSVFMIRRKSTPSQPVRAVLARWWPCRQGC